MPPLRIPFLNAARVCGSLCSLVCALTCGFALAQTYAQPSASPPDAGNAAAANSDIGPAILEWVPPALTQLSMQALAKESFTFDRSMLVAAAGLLPDTDADVKQSVAKVDGVSVHILRFAAESAADPAAVDAIRESSHLRGSKHVIISTSKGGPVHSGTTDLWLVLDGANVRGAVVLVESPRSLTLATLAGNLSPVDLLRLRGHFGIPRFEGVTSKAFNRPAAQANSGRGTIPVALTTNAVRASIATPKLQMLASTLDQSQKGLPS